MSDPNATSVDPSGSDSGNPTASVSLDFRHYLAERRRELEAHTTAGGIADYAFGLDHALRQKIAAMAPARQLVRMAVAAVAPIQKHLHRMEMIAIGPRQFPEIHALGETCARRLGIGIPQIFILPSPELAAYTFATDDVAPMLVLSSALIDALEPAERMFVIGHECGHIHNLHGAYNTAVQNLANPLAKMMLQKLVGAGTVLNVIKTVGHAELLAGVITGGLKMFFMHWSRCAEVTCDRAGLICCGDLRAAQMALAKIATGGAVSLKGINIDEYLRQIDETRASALRLVELFHSHPLIPKRLAALRLFASCEVLYKWRPELKPPAQLHTKSEIDEICRRAIGVMSSGGSSEGETPTCSNP